ncbi:uncharacterized protein LOC119600111 [Lucilia sericata]|uniref:uncharacterized protein LOC119600111 n=1 Tax=Lucilia sericata TaxID=13632 RepID=UPI0018A85348|nr:uncharacterized protein LOC119600111 [Lucilia sericata]
MISYREKDVDTLGKRNTFGTGASGGMILFHSKHLNKSLDETNINQQPEKKPSILTMKDEWTTYSSIGVQRKILKQNTKIIKNFINSLAVPSWYRGVSLFQKKSADLLLNAIRDDCAQRTVYRTMRCLDSIGLDPLPTKKQLHSILPLCGGSDLALLWFLMEWLYRDNESDSYSVNEQLILSSIAHLDMNATLRELDRILPPGQAPKSEIFQSSRKNFPNRKNNSIKPSSGNILPYFEKLGRPRLMKSSYFGREFNRKEILQSVHQQFSSSSHLMTNESYRGFQGFNNNHKETTVHNLAKDEITRLLNNFESATFNEGKIQTVYRQQEDIDYLTNTFNAQLNAIAKMKVQEMEHIFDRKHQSYKRIVSRLQCDIEKYRHEFRAMAEICHKQCNLKLSSNTVRENKPNMVSTLHSNQDDGYGEQQNINSTSSSNRRYSFQRSPGTEFPDKYDFSSKTSENDTDPKYFFISQQQPPFKFDYCKMFNYKEFIKEEDSDGLDVTASNYIHQIWEQELRKHEVIELTSSPKDRVQPSIVDYGLDYYDPDDDELMDRMLKDAIDIMKKDHRFVFAAIPAAHRFPMLREWIRLRYGKTYKKNEMIRSFKESQPIFSALAKVGLPVELPSNANMGTDLITDYSCRDYVLKKSNYIRNKYYRRIDKAILALSRVIYFAMRPLLCCNGSPSNTIFAYMPAHKRKSYHFRPWKPEECMKRSV